jgi:enoyl-CoA hydratase/carnithine racemase
MDLMQSLFNYNTLNVSLVKSTRSIWIKLNKPENNHSINMEMLFELESLIAWLTNKVEIQSVFLTSEDTEKNQFSQGYSSTNVKKYSQNQILKLTDKLQKIVQAFHHLPQTIVIDLKKGASNLGCELATAADIRVAHEDCEIEFDHNKLGLTPSSSGMSTLALLVGQMHARNFLLSGQKIDLKFLSNSGFVYQSYDDNSKRKVVQNLLVSIRSQAPVQRIQTKLGVFDLERAKYEQSMKVESQIGKASLMSEDWKIEKNESTEQINSDDFMPAKSMSYVTKLTLVDDASEKPAETPLS